MNVRDGYSKDTVVGLDVGTTKICAMVGERINGGIRVLSIGSSPSTGLRKGIVVDADATTNSIKKALKEAEDVAGFRLMSAYVGIAGGHIKSFNGYGAIGIKDRVVREEDLERLMDYASAVYVPVDREILHLIPAGFKLDGHNGIKEPVGMSCEKLEANFHIVTGSLTSVQNLVRCCERAGIDVADIVLEPLASAESVLAKDEKERGVALIDIGGGTTDIAVYKDGMLRHTAVLALGGNHITNDIAVGLRLSSREAERIKKTHGYAVEVMSYREGDVDAAGIDGHIRKFPKSVLTGIIQPRCEEIMLLVKKEIESLSDNANKAHFSDHIAGVVLTGGTSLLNGINETAEMAIKLPVRTGIPEAVSDNFPVNNPIYATGAGLVYYGLDRCRNNEISDYDNRLTSSGIFDRMRCWVKELF